MMMIAIAITIMTVMMMMMMIIVIATMMTVLLLVVVSAASIQFVKESLAIGGASDAWQNGLDAFNETLSLGLIGKVKCRLDYIIGKRVTKQFVQRCLTRQLFNQLPPQRSTCNSNTLQHSPHYY
jgi:hypothetical protein